MGQRWFTVAIGVMWFTSMGWLVSTKLWPLLRAGTPPSNLTVYTQQKLAPGEELPPVGWNLYWGGKPLGWAVSSSSVNSEGFTTIRSHAHFVRVPIEELFPGLFQPLLRLNTGRMSLDAESRLVMDAEGRLNRISFVITTPELPKPIRVEGYLKNDKFFITLFSPMDDKFLRWELPADAVIGNDLTPLVRLPDLHLEQTWNLQVYRPFSIGKNYLEVVQAKVERSDLLHWEEEDRRVWLVVMRRDAGSILGRPVRGKMWVDHDGTVLQQESYLHNSKLTFTRVRDAQAKQFSEQSEEIRLKRLRAYDVEEFDPSSVPEDKIEVLPIVGGLLGDGAAEPPRTRNGHHRRGHEAARDGYLRRHERSIWDDVKPLAEPRRTEDDSEAEPADDSAETEPQSSPAVPAQP